MYMSEFRNALNVTKAQWYNSLTEISKLHIKPKQFLPDYSRASSIKTLIQWPLLFQENVNKPATKR